jgi:flagellar protein FliS
MYNHQYVDNEVLNVQPVELVCLLYSKAIEKLNQARVHLAAGRIRQRSEAIGRAMEIVAELQGSLDTEAGGEIARNLNRLYFYVQERLVEANGRQMEAPLAESVRLLTTLYEGWKECRDQAAKPCVTTVPAEAFETGQVSAMDFVA